MNKDKQITCKEDEIDLRDLFLVLAKNKKWIIIVTSLITLISAFYVNFKSPIPIYKGQMMIEIGKVQSNRTNQIYVHKVDDAYVLKNILEQKYHVNATVPKYVKSIVIVSATNKNKSEIKDKLKDIFIDVSKRHKEMSKLFDKYLPTRQVGSIEIGSQPINLPKKKLIIIVAFITGLISSIFFIFLLEFIKGLKKEDLKVNE